MSVTGSGEHERLFRPPEWDWEQAGEVGWWVHPTWRQALLGPEGLRLDEWRNSGRLTTVKTGPHRVVYRADLPEGTVYVKHFLVPNLRAKVRQWVRRGKGRNEGKRARRLARIGIRTITPIALGEQRKNKFLLENYLITHAIAGMEPLDSFVERELPTWPEPRRTRVRQALAVGLAEMTARLHDAGFLHQDFHPGNVLVALDRDDHPHLAMIDLDALRIRTDLTWKEARANLALLNHYFWFRSARSDRLRFLTSYLEARQAPNPPPLRGFTHAIERATRAWAEKLWRSWGRRCRKTNKYFKRLRVPGGWGIAVRDLDRNLVRRLLADPDAPFGWPGTVILKDSRTTTVAELTLPLGSGDEAEPVRVIYKRFNAKKRFDPWLCLARPSRGWRAWQAGQHLLSRAVATPRNLAFLTRTDGFPSGLPKSTYVVTIKAEETRTLADLLRDEQVDRRRWRHDLIPALARLIRTLHDRSLSHRDLKAANILVREAGNESSEAPEVSLIDLVGVSLEHPLSNARRYQNLARLYLSVASAPGMTRTEALRFLLAYLPGARGRRGPWKRIWREVAYLARGKVAQNLRRGRTLS